MKVKREKDYYDINMNIFKTKEFELKRGISVLVGCNGYGKSTTLKAIKQHCRKNNIPLLEYDGVSKQDSRSLMSSLFYHGNTELGALMLSSSEGENKSLSFGLFLQNISGYIKEHSEGGFVITIDAVDSGMSVDELITINEILGQIKNDVEKYADVYVIISTNNYEIAKGFDCMDVNDGKYRQFINYEEYKEFILKTRKIKDKRYEEE